MSRVEIWAPDGLPEIEAGADLAVLVADAIQHGGAEGLRDGDIVVITSKVVSKAEGRVRRGDRDEALSAETSRVVATRGRTVIVRNRLGLTMAAAGIDASNVTAGHIVLLPLDPDGSARALRRRLAELTGAAIAVIVTDTAGRAWREGQTDIAIGAAGLVVSEDFAGRVDSHGNDLVVTMPAVADEIAGAAELAQGKLGGRPVAVVRGRADLVLAPDDDGPGAAALIRDEGGDLFGYGAREAVLQALVADPERQRPFGSPVTATELMAVLTRLHGRDLAETDVSAPEAVDSMRARLPADSDRTAVSAVAFAHGWLVRDWQSGDCEVWAVLSPTTP